MERSTINTRTAGFSLLAGMAAVFAVGYPGGAAVAQTGGYPAQDSLTSNGTVGGAVDTAERMVLRAETRVARASRSAAARTELAQIYFAAGRFASAATTFEDAITLGDKSPRSVLSLALSYIATGRQEAALEVLEKWQDRLPASDLGLAIALAGETGQGVAVLGNTLRGGENTAKVRQNLAYAYALDGRWAEARVVAGQDVPGDQLHARMEEWARVARPGQEHARIASLLGVPMVQDQGQPSMLALHGVDRASMPQMAERGEFEAPQTGAELPALATADPSYSKPLPEAVLRASAVPAAYATAVSGGLEPSRSIEARVQMAEVQVTAPSPIAPARPMPLPAPVKRNTIERAYAPQPQAAPKPKAAPAPQLARAKTGNHVVQLGSFSSMEGARRAWAIFQRRDPSLRDRSLRITQAVVNGRRYFRVAAVGFDRDSARSMCSSVKQRGGSCLAYTDGPRVASVSPQGRAATQRRG